MNFDPVGLLTNSFGGNRRVEVCIEICRELGSCGLKFYGYNQGLYPGILFKQLPLAWTVTPVGCDRTFAEVSLVTVDNVPLDSPQRLAMLVTSTNKAHTNNLSSFEL